MDRQRAPADGRRITKAKRGLAALLVCCAVVLAGCSAGGTGAQGPGAAKAAPAPTEIVAGLWAPATSADTALADEVNRVWTENDVNALDRIFAADQLLFKSWNLPNSADLDTVRADVASVPYTYRRLSPVTVTTDAVVGLPPLPDGWRYLHWVSLINGSWFDSVSAVDEAGLIHVGYIDHYQKAWWRLANGFPVFSID